MDEIIINGRRKLDGTVKAQGSKNSVLPILAATLLNEDENIIHNCPKICDVYSSLDILNELGCETSFVENTAIIDSSKMNCYSICEKLMREMRSSVIFMGAIISRCKKAVISTPGGCELGPRPIDLHLKAFKKLGVEIEESHGFISCNVDKINCGDIHLDFPSVGATENIMLLTVISDGITTILNAAKEPEIVDLANYLNKMGGKISGAGTGTIEICGVKRLHNVEHTVISDRIVVASYLIAAAITNGQIKVTNINNEIILPITSVLSECGADISFDENNVTLKCDKIKSIDYISTQPHPGFPTDAQPPICSLLSVADGTSVISENMFTNRYKHTAELNRMGADIKTVGKVAVIRGVKRLSGAKVSATDLRGAAALIIAGLNADGTTSVSGLNYLDRGYENFEDGLMSLGADIKRIN